MGGEIAPAMLVDTEITREIADVRNMGGIFPDTDKTLWGMAMLMLQPPINEAINNTGREIQIQSRKKHTAQARLARLNMYSFKTMDALPKKKPKKTPPSINTAPAVPASDALPSPFSVI